jgi:predicted nucleic acid-binding protein
MLFTNARTNGGQRDGNVFATSRIHGSRQVTDLYLLALASKHKARLATFDRAIPLSAVPAAKAENLAVVQKGPNDYQEPA